LPHPTPSTSYIFGANNGNEKPAIVRTNAAAPVALAAYVVYVSTTYAWAQLKHMMSPMAKIQVPMFGTTQCT
jgi:hypothetical protein